MKPSTLICVVGLSLGLAACSGNGNDAGQTALADDREATDTIAPAGTSGIDETATEADAATADLPGTASPLVLAGVVGLFSLAGVAGLRLAARR
jgi:hypothetical protein